MKGKVKVIVDGVSYEVEIEELGGGKFKVSFEGESYEVQAKDLGIPMTAMHAPAEVQVPSAPVSAPSPVPAAPIEAPKPQVSAGGNAVTAPMPGKILKVLVKEGDSVKTGQGLLILEAMKMENEIPSPVDGVVKTIHVKEGDTVDTGQLLIELG
ncbi:acetyl-CoA carboxylase [Palaeococcus pacificus DY20341]|uniref:Acetyl-CoA carboxylase n=1 Tax=Palaeococcus pacificus DY20341 TaxID=1343739 RepID=A0A075LVE7_9EURY|nr:acetyl-CoA carboxylase biotin carboxyl carrier protein subunit [Palaeococcus pacificus]AIF69987.1 acetyl-CoA carboxylase [Palaeococcus pacificus DY20341]